MLFQKIVFVLGSYEFLAMLEGKIGVTPLIQDLDYAKKNYVFVELLRAFFGIIFESIL